MNSPTDSLGRLGNKLQDFVNTLPMSTRDSVAREINGDMQNILKALQPPEKPQELPEKKANDTAG